MHCHSFSQNNPQKMVFQIRHADYGTPTIVVNNGDVQAITTKSHITSGRLSFTSWYPGKDLLAFSMNNFTMLYHTGAKEVRDVFDLSSDIGVYDIARKTLYGSPLLASKEFIETMPEWSVDGKFLYFCRALQVQRDDYAKLLCDLLRISFDCNNHTFGGLDTILTSQTAGGSITQPRFSPDGKYIAISVSPYSDFPIHQAKSGIYILDIDKKTLQKVDPGNGISDTWHSWSSNGSWMVFSSKRMDGRFTRPYICFVDTNGTPHTPFVLPQKDPDFYASFIQGYTIPELVKGPVNVTSKQVAKIIVSFNKNATIDAATGATGSAIPSSHGYVE
jgi:Tol biopolymer transport system component